MLNFRDSVIAPDDFYILGFDLSQAEYRAVAGLANETALIEAFETGKDVHEFVARMMFKIPADQKVEKQFRSKAKTIGFGLLFGMTAAALAKRLNCSIEEAEDLFAQYFLAFPRLKRWTEKQVEFGYEHGFVTTKFGRVIPIWELQDSRRWIREGGERACFNYPVQGGATGDYVRIGMVRARKAIRQAGLQDKVKLFMNVHDALEFYVHRSLNPADVIRILQPCVIFPVPGWPMMKADWHIGKRWGSVKEIELLENGDIKIEDGPVVSPGTTYLPTLEDGESVQFSPVFDKTEQESELNNEDSWSHCGSQEPHGQHKHDITFNEGTYKDVPCKGTPGTTYLPTLQTEEAPRHLIVEIQHMPTGPQFDNFLRIVEKLKGSSTVELKTPEGSLELQSTTGIDPDNVKHVGVVSLALGGATVRFAAQDVDLAELANDIAF